MFLTPGGTVSETKNLTRNVSSAPQPEVCVESLDFAIAAERGGADRVEICSEIACGGVTPTEQFIQQACDQLDIAVHVLIRPRAGDFCYSDGEFETMKRDIACGKQLGARGIVVGVLDHRSEVDVERTRLLVRCASPLPVTFHKAFDYCPSLETSLESVVATGANRILTSGGQGLATDGISRLAWLVRSAGERLVIMAGGGIRASNVRDITHQTGVREIHTSLGASAVIDAHEFESRVRNLRGFLASLPDTSLIRG